MLRAEVKGMSLTMGNLQKLEQATGQSMAKMLRGISIFATQSAVKLTPPGKSNYQRMAKKYRVRRTVAAGKRGSATFWYVKRNGQMFSTQKRISKKERDKRGLEQVKKMMQYWDKSNNRWSFTPVNPRTKKPNTRFFRSGLRIPGAGAAKSGWIHALRVATGKRLESTGGIRSVIGTGKLSKSRLVLQNNIRYGQKIASSVPKQAEQLAWKRIKGDLWRREKRKLERMKI